MDGDDTVVDSVGLPNGSVMGVSKICWFHCCCCMVWYTIFETMNPREVPTREYSKYVSYILYTRRLSPHFRGSFRGGGESEEKHSHPIETPNRNHDDNDDDDDDATAIPASPLRHPSYDPRSETYLQRLLFVAHQFHSLATSAAASDRPPPASPDDDDNADDDAHPSSSRYYSDLAGLAFDMAIRRMMETGNHRRYLEEYGASSSSSSSPGDNVPSSSSPHSDAAVSSPHRPPASSSSTSASPPPLHLPRVSSAGCDEDDEDYGGGGRIGGGRRRPRRRRRRRRRPPPSPPPPPPRRRRRRRRLGATGRDGEVPPVRPVVRIPIRIRIGHAARGTRGTSVRGAVEAHEGVDTGGAAATRGMPHGEGGDEGGLEEGRQVQVGRYLSFSLFSFAFLVILCEQILFRSTCG